MKLAGKYPVYEIEWTDSVSSHGWYTVEEAGNSTSIMRTIAAVIARNEECITVTHTTSGSGRINDPFTIPRCAIRKMKRLR